MSQFDQQWQKLTALARQAPADGDILLPPGFATRVAARAASDSSTGSLLERFALRGLLAAATCCVAAIGFSYFGHGSEMMEETSLEDPVTPLLDFS